MKTIYFFLLLFTWLISISCSQIQAQVQIYRVEGINDQDILKYQPPNPVHVSSHSFVVSGGSHEEEISVNSTNLRNLSITIENTGQGIIRTPHLFGPHAWDVRADSTALKALAAKITSGNLTKEQQFFRVLEWAMLHSHRYELHNNKTNPDYRYADYYHRANASRLMNYYGGSMCGEFHDVVNSLLVRIPDAGIVGCKYPMGGHTAGGVMLDGSWHGYNGSPTIQMAHYKMDGKTLADWADLKNDPAPIDSVNKYIGHSGYYGGCFNPDSLKCPMRQYIFTPEFYDSDYLINFKYSDLRPNEKMTMYFDMRGRYDSTSVGFANPNRNYVDYGSVVYSYKPTFKNTFFESSVIEKSNVQSTKDGLIPVDPSKPSFIVFASNHYPWYHVGADINAWFKTDGEVFIGRNNTVPEKLTQSSYLPLRHDNVYVGQKPSGHHSNLGADTLYTNITWTKLDPDKYEYGSASITGRSAFWVKFEFSGKGSGIDSIGIASELQMSPWAMPGLIYGKNNIRFDARDMGGSTAKITYQYDDQSSYYFYEPATSSTGKHIYHRLGGKLQTGRGNWARPKFWKRLQDSTDVTVDVTVSLFNVQNTANIRCVRTLFANKPLKWGYYWWYWDGRDDEGKLLPPGMYAYRIDCKNGTELIHTALTYLYPDGIWPLPNEIRNAKP